MPKLSLRHALCLPALLCLAWLPMAGQAAGPTGSGKTATETRALPEFQAIQIDGAMDLQIRQGAQQVVEVQADDNLLPLLETVVEGNDPAATLHVRWKKSTYVSSRSKLLVRVMLPKLSAIGMSGSGDVQLEAFNTPALKLALSGSGNARLKELNTEDLVLSLSGSSDVVGTGKASRLKVSIAGSGNVQLADLQADEVRVSIAGSGDASVNAQKTLDVSVAGSGDVVYTGNATVKSRVAGSGSIRRR